MADKERDIIQDRLLNLKENERLFRINAGMGWVGKIVKHTGNMLILKNPRPLRAAPTGWPDLCGWTEIEITSDMVGQRMAIFTGEEVKATGKLSAKQNKFKEIILRMGGYFRVLKS